MDTIIDPPPAPKKPAKVAKRRKRAAVKAKTGKAAVVALEANDEQAGLTAEECCFDCNADGCVISGKNFCGHPAKGSPQPAMQRDPEAMKRYNAARKKLAHQKVEHRK